MGRRIITTENLEEDQKIENHLRPQTLSTTTFLLGPDKGMDLINSLDGVEAVFIDTDNNLTYSDNFPK